MTGVDLIEEYIETARILNNRIGISGKIQFEQSNAMDLPFDDDSFHAVFSQNITMNIEYKTRLAEVVRRVLRLGGQFVLYEICAGDSAINYLVESQAFRQTLEEIGFKIIEWQDVTIPSLILNQEIASDMVQRPASSRSPLGLHLLMGASTAMKMKNMMKNMQEDRIKSYSRCIGSNKFA